MEKKRLRKQISQEITDCSADELQFLSHLTSLKILADATVLEAETIVAFWPMPDEVDIRYAIRTLYAEGKTVLLPRVVSDTEMVLCKYEGDESLTPGAYGILEPVNSEQLTVNSEQLAVNSYDYLCSSSETVILVPGRAFDPDGHRLGRGKGYYDRFLTKYPQAHTIGVCYTFQIIDNVPTNLNDIPVKELIWKISK